VEVDRSSDRPAQRIPIRRASDGRQPPRFYDTLPNALSALGEGVAVLEGESFLYANEAFARMVGYEPRDLLTPTFSVRQLFAPENREMMEERLQRRLTGVAPEDRYEAILVRRDGVRVHVEVSVRALRMDQSGLRFAVVRDITGRKRAQEELTRIRKEVAESEKLAALGTLVSGLAHEVRTPLVYVQNSAHLLRQRVERMADGREQAAEALPKVDECLREIEEGVDRINRLVRDLGRYTRLPVNDKIPSSLDGVVADAIRLWRGAHPGSSVDLVERLEPTPEVDLDRAKIQQVVLNLLQNAAEAMPGGGAIIVRTEALPQGARLVVADSGSGIAPEVRERIFDPLYSTKPEGMGLGLSIVRRIVELHRGSIVCESVPDAGTTFTVTLTA
jgi:PAS domain S-box-containing protein